MAKKRGGGGSSTGLIVTLVFFVLSTVILGVTTYFGFADQATKEAAKKKAEDETSTMTKERDWYRFQAHLYRAYMGHPVQGKDAKDSAEAAKTLAMRKGQLTNNQLEFAQNRTDREEVINLVTTLDKSMPWETTKEDAPRVTYESRLADKDRQYAALARSADQLKRDKEEAERQAKEARDLAEEEKKNFRSTLVKLDKKAEDDLQTHRAAIDSLRKDLAAKGKEKEDETNARAEAEKKLAKEAAARKGMEGRVAAATRETRATKESLDEAKSRLAALYERIGVDSRAVETDAINSQALQQLKTWNRDWRIIELDRRGTMPYINLGSADNLTPQVTFSIHSASADGKLNPVAKGTLEVVRVIGPHLSQARVTSVKDDKTDPILKGDRLFNPTWDPNRKKRVALAGIADLGTENAHTNDDFRRWLTRQNVLLDAYIDTRDDKEPKIAGSGITSNTDYLILGDGLEGSNHPQWRNKEYSQRYDRLISEMKRKAQESGVPVITLGRYLDLAGFRPPRVVASPGANR